ncbi:glycoside hydrolase family 1 protein [Listeria ivanovii]|uniref:glycoside hydrolase family 1 protein n=1 Tax=Listeria ivanovii TaxID=1638 RepID=UPI00051286B5|nr:glycoside hydrolase family 1 protein [Listeria ivanovii]AIS63939.1 6-phospho-beta-glucosidase [Listeria ivanovii subsp. londoniensis]MBK1966271.1 glycoside hydrolase family 1 protein [Listeria ivanovii subsp. londoniensis]MBK1983911.1 glycoside hydrolase family 1 protein [Listeria ivanovii subsp. londoniensis]MBK1995987.1 glycoside hydrolase family 1 protein [Listeria ivanovii subsp. londoniensis]MBM5720187.1 glycoside hydrolase family 1 protein [Listeria ivanovii]
MIYKNNPLFPANFMWGASSAAWQVEGAVNEDGRTPAIIDLNSKTKKPFADNSVASDHYHHYLEDIALMKEAGFTSYRFSIAWPRIYPDDSFEPNQLGIDFYNHLIDALVKNGIEPIVTLYHYDMPVWVDEKYDGWYGRGIIDAFDQYARTCFKEFGDRVKYWLSINEQNMQICYGDWLGVCKNKATWFHDKWKVNHIMNLCHAKAVIACHELVSDGKIGPVPGYVPIYPSSANPEDQIAAMNAEELTEKVWNDFYAFRKYNGFIRSYWKEHHIDPDIQAGDMALIEQAKIDFFALNCYRSNVAKECSLTETEQKQQLNKTGRKGEFVYPKFPGLYQLTNNPYVETNDWDWEIDPVSLRYMLRYVWDHYGLPMMITENGYGAHEDISADGKVHDPERIRFLRNQIFQVGRAIQDGCQVIGYNPWSYTDLLSTGNGMAKRYGLVFINTTDDELRDLKRIPKDSYYWYSRLIKSNGQDWGEET